MDLFEKIKYHLRGNKYYRKYFQTSINDMRYKYRHIRYYVKKYFWAKDREVVGNTLYFIIDPDIKHPGLVDRLKAIVGLYYVAKVNSFCFKIIFKHPFKLEDYLAVNLYDWVADESDLSYSFQNSRLVAYNGSGKIPRLRKSIKQYHVYCYIGYDILSANNIPDSNSVWKDLYHELFKPSIDLQKHLDYCCLGGTDYVAVHLRFVNALEVFESEQFNFLSEDRKENLIQRCLAGVKDLIRNNLDKNIFVFSDSQVFLKRVKILPVIVLDGMVGHISFADQNAEIAMKTFVDFYMISYASRVVRILAPEMYNTVFSYYAAVIGAVNPEELHV